ncbi:MAG: GAF domain-containing protein [Egibacteraceae bacterium]
MDGKVWWFSSRVAGASRRVIDLEKRTLEAEVHDELLLDLVEELRTAMEELQVANEELRAQSEELQAARSVVEQERLHYWDLFAAAPDAYLVTDTLGVVQLANPEAAALLGLPSESLRGRPLALHVAPGARRAFRTELSMLKSATTVQQLTLWLGGRDAVERELSARIRAVSRSDSGVELYWTLREVGTARAEAQWLQAMDAQLGGTGLDRLSYPGSLAGEIAGWWYEMTGSVALIPDRQGHLRMVSPAEGRMEALERLHAQMGEGPALDAYRTGRVTDVPHVASDSRYPRFGPSAAQAGITSLLAHPLRSNGKGVGEAQTVGVLIMVDKHPCKVSEQLLRGASLLAEIARTLLGQAQEANDAKELATQLQTALDRRAAIEQATRTLAE